MHRSSPRSAADLMDRTSHRARCEPAGSLGIRGIAELLDNRFSLLWHAPNALPRHQTLNAMLD